MYDTFLKIDGVPGESIDDKHRGEIEISSFSFGVSQVGSFSHGGGAGAGKASFNDFNFSAPVNLSSPVLFKACATGQHFKKAVLTCRKAGDDRQQEFLVVTMTDVLVSRYANGSSPLDSGFSELGSDNDLPVDQVGFHFDKFDFLYTRQKPTGETETASST